MSESGDYVHGIWEGRGSFDDARKAYQKAAATSKIVAETKGVTWSDKVPEELSTDAEFVIGFGFDGSGSMGKWPSVIYGKLPFFTHEVKCYAGEDTAISFGLFVDLRMKDSYPVQFTQFTKVTSRDVERRLEELVIDEDTGGGNMHESSELLLLKYARGVRAPKALRKVLILITDEKPYPDVLRSDAEYVKVDLPGNLDTEKLMQEIHANWSLYLILKPYDGSFEHPKARDVLKTWKKYVPDSRISLLDNENDVMNTVLGLLAHEVDMVEEFRAEIQQRQADNPKSIATVYRSLENIAVGAPLRKLLKPMGSTLHRGPAGPGGGKLI